MRKTRPPRRTSASPRASSSGARWKRVFRRCSVSLGEPRVATATASGMRSAAASTAQPPRLWPTSSRGASRSRRRKSAAATRSSRLVWKSVAANAPALSPMPVKSKRSTAMPRSTRARLIQPAAFRSFEQVKQCAKRAYAAGVVETYGDGTAALAGIDLAVQAGETVALVGESGSGKTTLLRTFNRMVEPSAGAVRIEGRSVAELDPISLRRRVGYVPQDGGLIPHWRVERNVELVPRLLGWERERRRARTREMLELVGLQPEAHAGRYPLELSGGQRQRVAFA